LNAVYRKKVWFNKNTDSKKPPMHTRKTKISTIRAKTSAAKNSFCSRKSLTATKQSGKLLNAKVTKRNKKKNRDRNGSLVFAFRTARHSARTTRTAFR